MKKLAAFLTFALFTLSLVPVSAFADFPISVRITPAAPKFTDAERQAELARRRSEVAAKMADKSMLILFSAEPKIYTNDVDYVFRQENNLYYLTALKQENATFVMTKDGATVNEYVFIPNRNPQFETWNGKRYSMDEAATVSGLKTVVSTDLFKDFIQAVKDKRAYNNGIVPQTVYLLLPDGDRDNDGMREFRQESEFAKSLTGYKVENAQPIFADLRQVKSPYEIKLLQHAVDITTEAQMRSMAMAR